jgi:hypothetical protein
MLCVSLHETGIMAKRCKNTSGSTASRFLRDDIQGDRILLPYLTTGSRLRLSECCYDMQLYRDYLASVRVKEPDTSPEDIGRSRRRFAQWVTHWKPGYLQHLEVLPSSSFVLDLTLFGCFQGLKSLEFGINSEWASSLSILQALVSKGFTSLEVLYIHMYDYESDEMNLHDIFNALGNDACPNLRTLDITFPDDEVDQDHQGKRTDICHYLANAIGSGHWTHLRHLAVHGDYVEYDSSVVWAALAKGKCPNLVNVELNGFVDDTDFDLKATTAGTFLSGAFNSVEELRVVTYGNILLEGIEAHQYPSMKRLTVWDSGLDKDSLAALGRALAQGSFPKLETLTIPDVSPNNLLRGIQTACRGSLMPNLREIGVSLFLDLKEALDEQLVADFRTEFPSIVLRHIWEC